MNRPLADLMQTEEFVRRHIGPDDAEIAHMLEVVGVDSLGELLDAGAADFVIAVDEGVDLRDVGLMDRLYVGPAELEVTQIGKECHTRCAIFHRVGDCVMPREGIFVEVLSGGRLKAGDFARFGFGFCKYFVDGGKKYGHAAGLGIPVTLHWEFYFTPEWSAFGEVGPNLYIHPAVFHGDGWIFSGEHWFHGAVGGRYFIDRSLTLTLRSSTATETRPDSPDLMLFRMNRTFDFS